VAFPQRASLVTFQRPVEPSLRVSPPVEYYPAKPSRPAAASRPLSWAPSPYSTSGTAGPLLAGFTCPLRSAFRVWLPSWRFPPFDSVPVLFRTGGAHGIHPSELSPPERYPRVPTGMDPPTVSPTRTPPAEAEGRPRGPRFLGFDPSGNPSRPSVCLARQPLDAPLGFTLRGSAREGLDRGFARSPLTRFIEAPGFHVGKPRLRPAPQSVDRLSPCPAPLLAR
jgi:hypothetical protein